MKRIVICLIAAVFLASCVKPFLVDQKQMPEFKAPADKALFVVIRHQHAMGSNLQAHVATLWLDGKIMSGTANNTVTSFEVPAGEHLVSTRTNPIPMSLMAHPTGKIKYNFMPNKIYFAEQVIYTIGVGVGTTLKPITGPEAMVMLQEDKEDFRYVLKNPGDDSMKDLSDAELKELLADWDKWAKEKPEEAKEEIEYPGY